MLQQHVEPMALNLSRESLQLTVTKSICQLVSECDRRDVHDRILGCPTMLYEVDTDSLTVLYTPGLCHHSLGFEQPSKG